MSESRREADITDPSDRTGPQRPEILEDSVNCPFPQDLPGLDRCSPDETAVSELEAAVFQILRVP